MPTVRDGRAVPARACRAPMARSRCTWRPARRRINSRLTAASGSTRTLPSAAPVPEHRRAPLNRNADSIEGSRNLLTATVPAVVFTVTFWGLADNRGGGARREAQGGR
jgi:hypothetical protein